MHRRVVVTGMGCVTSLENDLEKFWAALRNGVSGVGRTTLFDTTGFSTKISAEVRNWSMSQVGEDPARWKHCPRQTQFAIGAAKQAFEMSMGTSSDHDPMRLGVYLGCGDMYQDFSQFAAVVSRAMRGGTLDLGLLTQAGLEMLDPATELELQPHMPVSYVASILNAQGPIASCYTACAASSQAIGEASEIIRRGDADVMLAGGTHSLIHPWGVSGLNLLTALSTHNDPPNEASRPFDRDRDGFVLGEGSGVLVLEEYERARARSAQIFGEIKGFGATADAHHVTEPHAEGRGAARCMQLALTDAEINPDEVGYINAHGTSTALNDRIETLAIKRVFGRHAYRVPISSTKSMTGHLLAGAGAIEAIACLMALRDNVLPPTINYHTPDSLCDLDYIPNVARESRCQYILSNSFGFGGQNASLIFGRAA